MSDKSNFFAKKKGWSILKDKIIDSYLTPYMNKILYTRRPLVIIDCFAGKGKFDNGDIGSPIIIGEHIKTIIENPKSINKSVSGVFIEKKYAKSLVKNMSNYKNCHIEKGTFEKNVDNILKLNTSCNVFLYVDPYGIKSLEFENFGKIKEKNFNSLELLMNFNSFGFLREGCRILKYKTAFDELAKNSEDYYEIDVANDITCMNKIASGDYWQNILKEYQSGKIDMFSAEEEFIKLYVEQLENLFCHVVNIPIKLNTENIPKYRLIFGTNHEDGLILMSNEMNKAWKNILNYERKGQQELFEYKFPDLSVTEGYDLEEDISNAIRQFSGNIELKELIVNLIKKYGISFSEKEYTDKIRKMKDEAKIKITHTPDKTLKGKKAIALDYKKYKIEISLI